MRLSTRVTVGILALAVFAAAALWAIAVHGILHPHGRQVFEGFVDEAVFVADRLEAGEDPKALSRGLGLRVRRIKSPPDALLRRGRVPPERRNHRGREVVFHPGPRDVVGVKTQQGWVVVERGIDLERPTRLLRLAMLLGVGIVVVVAIWLGRFSTRPLSTAQAGMERIAAGDLAHRIDEQGPPELRSMARAFNGMADRIDGLLRSEKALLAGVSHELRTPLSRLRLEVELLRDGGAPASRMDAMEADLAELDELIGQLLAISRMQLGETPVRAESVDLRELAEEAVAMAQVDGVTVHGAGTRDIDRGLFQRVLVNLLSNAGRYGAPPIEVEVSSDALEVRDRGPGVAEADLPHLFDPFYRGEGSRSRATGGLGLGLMLVAQVAELHGARAVAQNRPGGGLLARVTWVPIK